MQDSHDPRLSPSQIRSRYNHPSWFGSIDSWHRFTATEIQCEIAHFWQSVPFQVDFAASKTIDEIDVFSLHDDYTHENTPTEAQTFTLYGLVNFEVQYWNGSAWVTIPGGSVNGNNKVWRKFTFTPITTNKVRLWITGVPDAWSRLVELQAWQAGSPGGGSQNASWTSAVGVSTNGSSMTKTGGNGVWDAGAVSTQSINAGDGYVEFTASEINTFRMCGLSHGDSNQSYADIDFAMYLGGYPSGGQIEIYEAGVWRGAFGPYSPGDILRVAVEGGVVKYRKNGTLLYTSTLTANYPLLVDTAFYSNGATLSNVVVGGATSGGASAQIRWLVPDQLGTPRMVFDQTGSFAGATRHDYLPFGEEVPGNFRAGLPGYGTGDGVRQKFTEYEADAETALNFARARYHSPAQGKFTSVDPIGGDPIDPQSWNGYSYVLNNPMTLTDPLGLEPQSQSDEDDRDPFIAEARHKQKTKRPPSHEEPYVDKHGILRNPDGSPYKLPDIKVDDADSTASLIQAVAAATGASIDNAPLGDSDSSPAVLGSRFLTGIGPRRQTFGPNAGMTKGLKSSPEVAKARRAFLACIDPRCIRMPNGLRRYGPAYSGYYGRSSSDGPISSGLNIPRQFVGGFQITITERLDGTAHFVIDNDTGVESGAYHQVPNAPWQRGPLSTIHQTFYWNERIP